MRTLVLIILFIAVPLAGGQLRPLQESEFWKDSGAGLEFARAVINDDDCASSEQYFHSCRKALLLGADLLKKGELTQFKELKGKSFDRSFKFSKLLDGLLTDPAAQNVEWVVGRMVNAQLKSFDPYAQLIPASFSELQLNGENKNFFGTGIEAEANANGLYVLRVFAVSAAASAQIQVHDRITAMNGVLIDSLGKARSALGRLNGKAGEKLVLEIEREGRPLHSPVTLRAAALVYPGHTASEIVLGDKSFLHLRLSRFQRGACDYVKDKVAEKEWSGLLLDLRQNTGGLVHESECIVRLFTRAETVVSREPLQLSFPRALNFRQVGSANRNPGKDTQPLFPRLPVVVLIDSVSASASEIAAAALQDLHRSWIVGERSFGKGTTQILHELSEYPKLRVSKTVSRYMRPSGLSVHEAGVTPNFEVSARPNAAAGERRFEREEDRHSMMRLPSAGGRWSEKRGPELGAIRQCLEKSAVTRDAWRSVAQRLGHSDQQAAAALAIANCELNMKHNSSAAWIKD